MDNKINLLCIILLTMINPYIRVYIKYKYMSIFKYICFYIKIFIINIVHM